MKKTIIVIKSKMGMMYAIDKNVYETQNKKYKFVNLIDKKTNKKNNLDKVSEGEYTTTFSSYKDDDDNITLFGVSELKEL